MKISRCNRDISAYRWFSPSVSPLLHTTIFVPLTSRDHDSGVIISLITGHWVTALIWWPLTPPPAPASCLLSVSGPWPQSWLCNLRCETGPSPPSGRDSTDCLLGRSIIISGHWHHSHRTLITPWQGGRARVSPVSLLTSHHTLTCGDLTGPSGFILSQFPGPFLVTGKPLLWHSVDVDIIGLIALQWSNTMPMSYYQIDEFSIPPNNLMFTYLTIYIQNKLHAYT